MRQSSNSYSTLDEVLEDIDLAVSDIMEKLQLPNGTSQNLPPSPEQAETSLKISTFKKRAHELVQREKAGEEGKTMSGVNGTANLASYMVNGGLGSNAFTQINASSSDSKLVLTLYGNAPVPKQLFSSLQLPIKVDRGTNDIVQALREDGLPNGITTTQIVPLQSPGLADDRKRVPTLGELFPTPPTVPPLQLPKPSKIATTRSSTVGWYHPAIADPPPRSGNYFRQPISAGRWLDYSNASPSPDAKRKQRDRALSLNGPKATQVDVDQTETEATKLDALFRSAYSGFAPTKDDAAAIVPEGMMNRIWWQNVGEKSFERYVQNANNLDDVGAIGLGRTNSSVADNADEEEKFKEAIEAAIETAIDPKLEATTEEKSAMDKDIEEVLVGISELLETLNSYQRIRHLSLNSPGRPTGLLSASETTSFGTTSKPSEPEMATYEILKSQLTLMIASLPPFAVAKLDSNKLAELAISTKIEIPMDDYNGVMEEDEASARAKAAALSAASASRVVQPPSHSLRASSSALYGNQYTSSRPAPPAQNQYYGSAQTPIRQSSNNLQRPPATAPVPYQPQRPVSGASYRTASYGTPPYQHQAPRPQQPYTPQYHPAPNQNYTRPPAQPYQGIPQSTPQAAMNPRYPGQPAYPQQAPSQSGIDYRYGNGVNPVRQGSPQKPMQSPQPPYSQAQPRPSYATPGPSMPQDRRPYLQNPMAQSMMNGGTTPSNQSQNTQQQQLGPTNYSTFMTTEQQSSMMERQRAQLAQQQGAQQQARNAAQAGVMGSPSKAQVNGSAVAAGL